MRKYDRLRDRLSQCDASVDEQSMTFGEIDRLVKELPPTARTRQSWWTGSANPIVGSDTWPSGSWRVRTVDLTNESVLFCRREATHQVGPMEQPHDEVTINSAAGTSESHPVVQASDLGSPQPEPGATKALSRWEIVRDVTGAALAAVCASIAGIVGITHLPWGALAGLSAAVAAVGFTLPQAAASKNKPEGLIWWRITCIVLVLLCAAIPIYHFEFDPATRQSTYQFVINGNQDNIISLYGEPGSQAQTLQTGVAGQNGLIGGQTYVFDCYASASNGTEWLRYERYGQTWWAPRADVHVSTGTTQASVPRC